VEDPVAERNTQQLYASVAENFKAALTFMQQMFRAFDSTYAWKQTLSGTKILNNKLFFLLTGENFRAVLGIYFASFKVDVRRLARDNQNLQIPVNSVIKVYELCRHCNYRCTQLGYHSRSLYIV
jgi:hypothetical protein